MITFQDRNKTKECCYGACGDEIVSAGVADTRKRVVFDIESDDPSTVSVGASEGRL